MNGSIIMALKSQIHHTMSTMSYFMSMISSANHWSPCSGDVSVIVWYISHPRVLLVAILLLLHLGAVGGLGEGDSVLGIQHKHLHQDGSQGKQDQYSQGK